jgi:hypothetical protein
VNVPFRLVLLFIRNDSDLIGLFFYPQRFRPSKVRWECFDLIGFIFICYDSVRVDSVGKVARQTSFIFALKNQKNFLKNLVVISAIFSLYTTFRV